MTDNDSMTSTISMNDPIAPDMAEPATPEQGFENAADIPEDAAAPHDDTDATINVIHFSDEGDSTTPETPLIRRLREQVRDLTRQVRSQSRMALTLDDPEPVIPTKPTLEACDYDPDRFEQATDAWIAARENQAAWARRQDACQAAQRRAREDQARAIEQQRQALGVPDYPEQAARVKDALSEQQLAILVAGVDNPAQLIYALGRSPGRLDTLAAMHDLAKFAVTVGKLERDVKVTKRPAPHGSTQYRSTPRPEARVHAATATGIAPEKTLSALEQEAERTGDRSRVIAYKRTIREQGRAARG